MNRKNTIVLLLILVALAVWSHNAYRIVQGLMQANDEDEETIVSHAGMHGNGVSAGERLQEQISFNADFRDPFAHWLREEKTKLQVQPKAMATFKTPEPVRQPPVLRLSGVLCDSIGMLALIEQPDGSVQFAREQDVVSEVTILAVTRTSIKCRFEDQEYEIGLR